MSPDEITAAFARTLAPDYRSEDAWEAVRLLHRSGGRAVFDRALHWCRCGGPLQRARGADIVAQIGVDAARSSNQFPEESFAEMARMAGSEEDPLPLASAIFALGHIGNPAAVPIIAAHRQHEDGGVRCAVACALGSFPNDPVAVQALLRLMADSDGDVRDWATFGLGVQGGADSLEIREALFARLQGAHAAASEEAMVGLAKRGDPRVLPIVLAKLAQPAITMCVEEAAEALLGGRAIRGWGRAEIAFALRQRFHLGSEAEP
jgi:HEAT repeat protein